MNLFSGLEKFGLKLDNNKNIYEEDKKEAAAKAEAEVKVGTAYGAGHGFKAAS